MENNTSITSRAMVNKLTLYNVIRDFLDRELIGTCMMNNLQVDDDDYVIYLEI